MSTQNKNLQYPGKRIQSEITYPYVASNTKFAILHPLNIKKLLKANGYATNQCKPCKN